nr:MAG TPA: hypothetical protein [Caudoviricetes sp.]
MLHCRSPSNRPKIRRIYKAPAKALRVAPLNTAAWAGF